MRKDVSDSHTYYLFVYLMLLKHHIVDKRDIPEC